MLKKNNVNHVDILQIICSAFFVCTIFFSCMEKSINANNLIYAIGHIHEYDHTIFQNNIFMATGAVSPRLILDKIFAFFMKLNGGKWERVAVIYIYMGMIVLAVAIILMAKNINAEKGVYLSIIAAVMFISNACQQVDFTLFELSSIGMGMGFAFVTLAIACVIGKTKNYNVAWILIGIAAFMHIHEGIYGFVVILILLLVQTIHEKKLCVRDNIAFAVCVACLLIVTIPNMLTDAQNISNEEFVNIYAYFRHPHHLVPSTWGVDGVMKSFMMFAFPAFIRGFYLLWSSAYKELKEFVLEVTLFTIAWIGTYIIFYAGIELLKIPAIAMLFPCKFFKYVGLMGIIWYLKTIADLFREKRNILSLAIIAFALSAKVMGSRAVLLCVLLLIWLYYSKQYKFDETKNKDFWLLLLMGSGTLYVILKYAEISLETKIVLLLIALVIISASCIKKSQLRIFKGIIPILVVGIVVVSLYGDVYDFSDGRIQFKGSHDFLIESCGQDIYDLAIEFKKETGNEDEFLANPDDTKGAGWFQIISNRNCYVLWKVIPSSKAMMEEWYNRYQVSANLFGKSTYEIAQLMRETDIRFLLVDSGHYDLIESDDSFVPLFFCENDSYRIYQLD